MSSSVFINVSVYVNDRFGVCETIKMRVWFDVFFYSWRIIDDEVIC